MNDDKPIPICKIARENGGDVPLECLFGCPHRCGEIEQAADKARELDKRADAFSEVKE